MRWFRWRMNYVDVLNLHITPKSEPTTAKKKLRALECVRVYIFRSNSFHYLVKFVKQTCLTNAAGGCKFDMAVVKSYCCSILKRIISTRWTGSRWNRKLFMNDRCFISSINVWLPTFGTRLKNKMSITALLVLFNSAALGITSGMRVVDRCWRKTRKKKFKNSHLQIK